ncbi:hypothetical protein B1992_10370 [Pseudoxanthomonas broegbernensis]|uniref:DUF5343 domain-containing protein n=1 Tax=Pseudoxanthomonas broegbernensis TaxID=83619 RepID=A0A7V8GLI3_9GAMM|nr:DUF5343 domain-containing protein [Pseudoxanthomonas broegbernensis]KAF1685869.1 hypothetical protein B1992_10370 [Pseudoxanthomonas broegbernensis]MBB6064089.1 hypothetical protein [Pseudoxanthomonas broegbernensis]
MNDKTVKPPYTSYRSFLNLMSELKEHDVMPSAIDRSYLSKRSGSEKSALIATLKWFELVNDDGTPTERLENFIAADEQESKTLLKEMVESSYGAITDGTFNLRSATTSQLADQFRQYEISGSTLSKSITFFLAAAKEAGIAVSPHAKVPPVTGSGNGKRKTKAAVTPPVAPHAPVHSPHESSKPKAPRADMVAIPIPIFGGQDGVIYLPGQMTEKQWENVIKMTEFILKNYRDTMAEEVPEEAEEEDESS